MVELTLESQITAQEAALYDRQIRLWGLDAQKRLRKSKILLIGLNGVGAEIAKNIVLAGIDSLTLLDHNEVTEEDFCSQFLIPRSDVGKNRAESSLERTQQLNSMVSVTADSRDVSCVPDSFFSDFDVICLSGCRKEQMFRINDICRETNKLFFCADVFGHFGATFTDLNEHNYAEEVQQKDAPEYGEPPSKKLKSDKNEKVTVKKSMSFVSFKSALHTTWNSQERKVLLKRTPLGYFLYQILLEFRSLNERDPSRISYEKDYKDLISIRDKVLKDLQVDSTIITDENLHNLVSMLSPVCAVVGGILGQEVIKAVSQKDPPHNNFFFFDGLDGTGLVDCIGSE